MLQNENNYNGEFDKSFNSVSVGNEQDLGVQFLQALNNNDLDKLIELLKSGYQIGSLENQVIDRLVATDNMEVARYLMNNQKLTEESIANYYDAEADDDHSVMKAIKKAGVHLLFKKAIGSISKKIKAVLEEQAKKAKPRVLELENEESYNEKRLRVEEEEDEEIDERARKLQEILKGNLENVESLFQLKLNDPKLFDKPEAANWTKVYENDKSYFGFIDDVAGMLQHPGQLVAEKAMKSIFAAFDSNSLEERSIEFFVDTLRKMPQGSMFEKIKGDFLNHAVERLGIQRTVEFTNKYLESEGMNCFLYCDEKSTLKFEGTMDKLVNPSENNKKVFSLNFDNIKANRVDSLDTSNAIKTANSLKLKPTPFDELLNDKKK